MKIDRAAFLAISTALAAGCAASSSDDVVQDDQAAISASGGEFCWSATESSSTASSAHWVEQIGFDPVRDYPAAEGFCFDAASTGTEDENGFPEFDEGVYRKCNSYAKSYVPHVVYTAYAELKVNLFKGPDTGPKWDALYTLDEKIAAEDFFCATGADRAVCASAADKPACLRASTQMLPAAKQKLKTCLARHDGFNAFSCIEGISLD